MHRAWVAIALASVLLAGCSDNSAKADLKEEQKEAFDDLGLDATAITGVIRGLVVDDAIRPLEGATLKLVPTGKETTSNALGVFGFQDLEAGSYFIRAEKNGYNSTQINVDVVVGVDEPEVERILLQQNSDATAYFVSTSHEGFITCGAAVVATSVGCTTSPLVAQQLGDEYIWREYFDIKPTWLQGELVWDQTQPAGGWLIWEIVRGGTNNHPAGGHRETGPSPALAYWDNVTIDANWDHSSEPVRDRGVSYRVFGGPHPLCTPPQQPQPNFGCGLTINQDFEAYVHLFYNWIPDEGWRFTVDGHPEPPV